MKSTLYKLSYWKYLKKSCLGLAFCFWAAAQGLAQCNHAADSLQLVAFYNSNNGANWTSPWNLNLPMTSWDGVVLHTLALIGCVEELNLYGRNIIGNIPNFNLSGLEKLDLSNNQLSGNVPTFNLTSLYELELWGNQLSGNIPNFNLPNLEKLSLGNNQLSGNIPNFNLPSLQYLHVWSNQLSGNIPNFSQSNALVSIDMSNNLLSGTISDISYLPLISELRLSNNNFTKIDPSFSSNSLNLFQLRNNKIDTLHTLNNLPSLQTLLLDNNKLTFNDILPNIGKASTTFWYSPQDSCGAYQNLPFITGQNVNVDVGIDYGITSNTYQWYKGSTLLPTQTNRQLIFSNIQPSDAGDYYCEIKNTIATALTLHRRLIKVNVICTTSAAISGATQICSGKQTSLSANSLSGASYLWSNGATNNSVSLGEGTHQLTVTANGCNATTTHTISAFTPPNAIISGASAYCTGSSTTLSVAAGNSYLWSTGASSNNINANSSTTYSVTVTDSNSCTAIGTKTITQNALPTAIISGNLSFCQGKNTNLTASGANTYFWNNASIGATLNISNAGVYSVTATDSNGCSDTESVTVIQNNNPTANITGTLSFCQGKNTILNASGASNFLWNNGNSTPSINVNSAGNYTVTVTDNNNCAASQTVNIIENALPSALISGSNLLCGIGTIPLTANPSGAIYLWNNGNSSNIQNAATSGTYTVTVTDSKGCSATANKSINITALPNITIDGSPTLCGTSATTLTASGGTNYVWSNGINSASNTINQANTYTVTVTDALGCSNTKSISVTAGQLPGVAVTGETAICNGQNTTLTATGGNNYIWNTGQTSASLQTNQAGTYSVTVTGAGGCTAITSKIVQTNVALSTSITGNTTICQGQSSVLSASGGTSFLWNDGSKNNSLNVTTSGTYNVTVSNSLSCTGTSSRSVLVNALPKISISGNPTLCGSEQSVFRASGGNAYIWNTGATSDSIKVGTTGTFKVTATDNNTCQNVDSVKATVYPLPLVTISSTAPAFCTGENVTLTANGKGNFLWNNAKNDPSILITKSGAYSVTLTSTEGCTNTALATILEKTLPIVKIEGVTMMCQTQQAILKVKGNNQYLWSNGATSDSIIVTQANTYRVTATSGNGCKSKDSLTLKVNPKPTAQISGSSIICGGKPTILTANGGNTYKWSNNETTAAISISSPNTYTVTVTDLNNCIDSKTINIISASSLAVSFSGSQSFCKGKNTLITATGGDTYIWNNGNSNAMLPITTAGAYTVTATASSGCTGTNSVNITEWNNPIATITGNTSFCQGQNTTLTASGASIFLWNTNSTTNIININTSANYSVTVTDTNGCSNSKSVTVSSIALPTANPITIQVCKKATNTLTNLSLYNSQVGGTNSVGWYKGKPDSGGKLISNPNNANLDTIPDVWALVSNGNCTNSAKISIKIATTVSFTQNNQLCEGKTLIWQGKMLSKAGTYRDTLKTKTGCDSILTLNLNIEKTLSLGKANAGGQQIVCENVTTLEAASIAATIGNWTSLGTAKVENNIDPQSAVTKLVDGKNLFVWSLSTKNCGTFSQDTAVITFKNQKPNASDDAGFIIGNDTTRILLLDNDTQWEKGNFKIKLSQTPDKGQWKLDNSTGILKYFATVSTVEAKFKYLLCDAYCPNLCDSATVKLLRKISVAGETAITPNDDGYNDVLIIDDLDKYPENEIHIYNRWGNVVFHQKPYRNDWKGQNSKGQILSQGAYYYVLFLDIGEGKIVTGDILLVR